MLAYPETQARAHVELDVVVGRLVYRLLPTIPCIRAMAKEVLR